MVQVPSVDWPRRISPLTGSEDLLKQNPVSDSFPQEERIPASLISDYTISQLLFTNVGAGIGVFDFKNINQINFRSISAGTNKVNVNLLNKSIVIDVDSLNIASEINLTDLKNVGSPSTSNQYLMWDGTSFVFNNLNPYSLTVRDYLNNTISLNSGDTLNLIGVHPIYISKGAGKTLTANFLGTLNDLLDVNVPTNVPDGHVLTYEFSSSQWKPKPPSAPSAYNFNIKGDGVDLSNVTSSSTVSILGNGSTISTVLSGVNEVSIDWTANLSDLSNVSNTPPINNQVLTYNSSSGNWEPKNLSSANLTFNNGLELNSNNVKLGGFLLEDTVINGNNFARALVLINLKLFRVTTSQNSHSFTFESNSIIGRHVLRGVQSATSKVYSLDLDSVNGYASLNSYPSSTRKFTVKASDEEASLFYEFNSSINSGIFAKINRLEIHDGVNTPSAGHVLTYMADGSVQYQPVTGGGGGGSDNWGTQVVKTDSSLIGEGTLSSTLKVAIPIPSGYINGQYLGVEGGNLTWKDFPQGEYIGICEIDKDSEVSVSTGKSFFVIPAQMNGWKISSYIARVFTLGSGGSTDIQIALNNSNISPSLLNLTTLHATKSSINTTVSTGDIISVNVTGAKTTKDKGLSITLYLIP